MRNIKKILLLFVITLLFIPNVKAKDNEVKLHLFYSSTCPHCAKEKEYLKTIEKKYKNLKIYKYEVSEEENSELFELVNTSLNDNNKYVPYTIIGTNSLVGFNDYTKEQIEKYIKECTKYECMDLVGELKQTNKPLIEEVKEANKKIEEHKKIDNEENKEETSKMKVPLLGSIDVKKFSLPLIAISIGLVDGFNPCSMWVLIFLISMLIGMKNRKRMWIIGLTFLLTSALIYLLFMASWLQVTLKLSQIRFVQILIALVALIGAFVNLNSFRKERKKDAGCQVVDKEKRKSIINRIQKFTKEKNLIPALVGTILLAVSINFVELACSAGLPLLFTQILALNNLTTPLYALYMILYIIAYLLDDIIVFVVAMITLKITGMTNKYNKYSHLIGGIIMLVIGLLMILKPEWIMMNF
ncbi:MAG: hypothetical protein J6K21_03255 [Bacilli bacterium]|nr:hypothetical protein [Bacilli bacterium]